MMNQNSTTLSPLIELDLRCSVQIITPPISAAVILHAITHTA